MIVLAWVGAIPAEARPEGGYTVGASLVVALDAAADRARVGAAIDGQYQVFWKDGAVVAPGALATAAAHVGWNHPVVWSELTAVIGPMYPWQVGTSGFRPLAGVQVGGGVQASSDGVIGPELVGAAVGPFSEARVEATFVEDWHAPRLLIGPAVSLTCCYTEFYRQGSDASVARSGAR
ncbi:MAG: hypothetical protein ABMB14_14430 [Myxococcota bacterium]